MNIIRHKYNSVPVGNDKIPGFFQDRLARNGTVIGSLIKPVELLAMDTHDHSPGRMIVRRDLFARSTHRTIQGKSMIVIFRKAIDNRFS